MTDALTLGASRAEGDAAVPDPAPAATAPRWAPLRRYGPPVAAIAVYALVAVLAYWPVEPFSNTRLSFCACSDVAQETWFLAYTAHAVLHGTNPFFTTLIYHPTGVNLALNTSMPLLGLLGAPITWLRGPVAAFNVLMRLSFVVSGASMLFVVRRLTRWWPAAFLAGLLYGFSPFMVGAGYGHLFLTFAPLPPLILLCLYELLRDPGAHPLRRGALLGLLCAAQYLVSIEVLVMTAVCAAVVALVALLRHPRAGIRRLGGSARALGAGLGVLVVLVAYPSWYFLRGAQHEVGPPHPVSNLAPIKGDLLGFVLPTLNQRFGTAHLLAVSSSFVAGNRAENGIYLGIPLLLLLGYLVVRFRKDDRVVLGALLTATGGILALGTPLLVDGHRTVVRLPFDVLAHLPLLKGTTAVRFDLMEQLGAALVLGVGLGRLREPPRAAAPGPLHAARRRRHLRDGVVIAAGVVALLPLVPRYPYTSQSTGLPPYVATADVDAIPPGSVVLTYPWDVDPVNEAMLWQAVAGMRFAIFGGQASHPGPDGRATSTVPQLDPPVVQQLFAAGFYGNAPVGGAPLPPDDAATTAAIVQFCRHYGVQYVLFEPQGPQWGAVLHYLTEALGTPPQVAGGLDIWPDVPALLAKR